MIRALFAGNEAPAEESEAALHLAAAVLLVKVAGSDQTVDKTEILRLRSTLRRDWQLDDAELDGLMAVAQDASENIESLDQHIDLINRNFSPARKLALVRSLWQAACADGQIHRHEEEMIQGLADLLHVSTEEFVRSKQWALGAHEGE